MSNQHFLKMSYVNVGGLLTKLNYPDFVNTVKQFDVFHFSETKLDCFDNPYIDGYSFFCRNRKKCMRKSGGVGIFVKNNLVDKLSIFDISNENCLWYKFNNLNKLFAVVYIPPESSPYSSLEMFDNIERGIIHLSSQFPESPLVIFGDFNARTCKLPDFTEFDPYIADIHLDDITNNRMSVNNLIDIGISLERFSLDKGPNNNYGYRLLDMCRSANLYIANGRCGEDLYIGKCTCKNASLVDYVLMSPIVFSQVSSFVVNDFDPLFSDSHVSISLTIKYNDFIKPVNAPVNTHVNNNVSNTSVNNAEYKLPIWDNSVKDLFHASFPVDRLTDLQNQLDDIVSNNSYSEESVNNITSQVSSLLVDVADKCNLVLCKKKTSNNSKAKHVNKTWFDSECKTTRKQYVKARNYHRRMKSADSYNTMVDSSRLYKKTLNKKLKSFHQDVNKKLKNLRSSDPKAFWNMLNKYSGDKKETITMISSQVFQEHFEKLNQSVFDDNYDFNIDAVPFNNTLLNSNFDVEEIKKAIKILKNNKSPSLFDNILNEYLKYADNDCFLLIICKLFNVILESGVFPEVWTKGIILPIFKNKGDVNNPNNYRGITILSCFGKLFTNVLNNRLNTYLENHNLLCEEQAGFRKKYSTVDHIFSLKFLIDFYLGCNKKLFCAFVDYKKAFDSVNRLHLWHKLLQHGIDGRCIKIMYNMYSKAKSCVKVNNVLSNFFTSNVGVRQGENLSPILFSVFLNDLSQFMSTKFEGLATMSKMTFDYLSTDDVDVYLRLFLLLYADDTVLLAENANELQKSLNAMYDYCSTWDLDVNEDKTKIAIFSKRKFHSNVVFTYNNKPLEIVEDFPYLGILFNYNGNFSKAKKRLVDQARRAMFSVIQKSRKLNLPVSLQLHLFDTMIAPILLYSSEVWGCENIKIIEQFQLKYYKFILNLKPSTPNCMIFGELGVKPISLQVKARLLCFWSKLVTSKDSKICHILYNTALKLHNNNIVIFPWISCVNNVLNDLGLSHYFRDQNVDNLLHFKSVVKLRLYDQFLQDWNSTIANSSKCLVYKMYKTNHCFEKYLDILPSNLAKVLCKYRTTNHCLPIEKGRHLNIERNLRTCHLCNANLLGDEFHYIFECKYFDSMRKRFIGLYYLHHPSAYKLYDLMNTDDRSKLIKLALLCKAILLKFK